VTILDACSLINLINGEVLEDVLELPEHRFAVGPQVLGECGGDATIIGAQFGARLTELSDEDLRATLFFDLLERYGLGPGETECLAFAIVNDGNVCSDDRKAREMAAEELGVERVLGTARLLRDTVAAGLLTPEQGERAYEKMRVSGGFLPILPPEYFR